jgi:hypothetical protein
MKTLIALLLLSCTLPAIAAEIDAKPNADRYVADDIEIATLPNGEVVTRLISNSKLTVRQFWTNSHSPQGFITIFPGQGRTTHASGGIRSAQNKDSQIVRENRILNNSSDFLLQASECK